MVHCEETGQVPGPCAYNSKTAILFTMQTCEAIHFLGFICNVKDYFACGLNVLGENLLELS